MARMKINITCPSACIQREPATTKASPAALSMISIDISIKTRLRRTNRPISPSANKIPASSSPSFIGTVAIFFLPFLGLPHAQVISAYERREQQERRKLHANQVRTEERDAHLLGPDFHGSHRRSARSSGQKNDFHNQNSRQNNRPHPHSGLQPRALLFHLSFAEIQQHHHKDKEHHDCASINDHFQSGHKRRAKSEENNSHGQQRNDQIKQAVHGVEPCQYHQRG